MTIFDRYGPNAIKVDAYIRALRDLTREQFAQIHFRNDVVDGLNTLAKHIATLTNQRSKDRENALNDAGEAVKDKGTKTQTSFAGLVAPLLVMDDFLNREEKNFLALSLVNPLVPLRVLYEKYQKEDLAIEVFCEQLSLIDGQNVHVKRRLDDRGRKGAGLPDFVVERNGLAYTLEHTSLNSYRGQVHYEVMWEKFVTPLSIKEKVEAAYPGKLIRIAIPINPFASETQAKQFDFDDFMEHLINAVGETPESHNAAKEVAYEFPNTPFAVYISNGGDGYAACFVTRVVPTDAEQLETDIENEIARAINKKREKLRRAKAREEATVLLLDSGDYSLLNEERLAEAFRRAVGKDEAMLDGIDDVYIQWYRIVVPVKLGERKYPDLPEFDQYIRKQYGL